MVDAGEDTPIDEDATQPTLEIELIPQPHNELTNEDEFELYEEEYDQDVIVERNNNIAADPIFWWGSVTNFCSQGGLDEDDDGVESEDDLQSLDSDDEGCGPTKKKVPYTPVGDYKEFEFVAGMMFATVKLFRQALNEYFIANDKVFEYVMNDTRRVRAKCKGKCCPWLIHASKTRMKIVSLFKPFVTSMSVV